jgi:hypothetical protein
MLSENKLSMYLIYAIGEVLLVVFGILIAFQIDRWNENRLLRNLENVMLVDIRENLIASNANLASSISYNKTTLSNYEKILRHIREDLPYSNSLDTSFSYMSYWSVPNFTYTAYETLKLKGLDIIQNDLLKVLITEIYEQRFPFLIDELKGEWELHNSIVLPFIARNIQYISADVARPNSYTDLKSNDEFHNLMGLKKTTREFIIQYTETLHDKIDDLILMIDHELSK